jgi:phosphodiesterase/alkaline phosphatase D-like protein
VCTPDDHEVDNNYAGLNEELPQDGGSGSAPEAFRQRRAAAYQAYYEHLPLRIEPPSGGDARIHRDLAWGALARFYVLDTRQYRTNQACARPSDIGAPCADVTEPARTMLGEEQEAWLGDALTIHYAEARHRGYVVVEVTPDELRADYRYVSTTAEPTAELSTGTSWRVRAGDPVPQPA